MADSVTQFIEAFNSGDLDRFVAALHPDIEIQGMRGLRRGIEEARDWATRPPGGVQQEIIVEERVFDGTVEGSVSDGPVLVNVERRWHWADDGSHAGSDELAWLFEVVDGRIRYWRPFEDREAALQIATGLERAYEID